MATDPLDAAAILEPVSADEPCGPDLDVAGDTEYFQVVSRIEGLLPAAFFTRDDDGRAVPFDRSAIDFAAEWRALAHLLPRTRDLRLLMMVARLSALNRNLPRFSDAVSAMAALLRERWTDVHPRPDGDDHAFRTAVLQGLDDMPTVVLPMQHVTLATGRRTGPVHFRHLMTANGEIGGQDADPSLDRTALDRAFAEAEIDDLRAVRDRLVLVKEGLDAIRLLTVEGAGFEAAVSLDRLPALVDRMIAAVAPAMAAREPDPAAEPGSETETGAPTDGDGAPASTRSRAPAGALGSVREAARLLSAVSTYLRISEPSSPAEPIVRQARELIGRSFVDVIRTLMPNHADEAKISIGVDRVFSLTFSQLADLPGGPDGSMADGDGNGDEDPEPAPIGTRRDAVAALGRTAAFFRSAEPSSPIPLLLDRASSMIERDFLHLLKDVLPNLFVRD